LSKALSHRRAKAVQGPQTSLVGPLHKATRSRVELVDRPSSDDQADRAALQPRLRLLLLSGEGEPFSLRQRFRTADDLLEAYVQRYIAATSAPEVEFTWQGVSPP
jgi:hypothetical protein